MTIFIIVKNCYTGSVTIPTWFQSFIELTSDRYGILVDAITEQKLSYETVTLKDARHILVYPKCLRRTASAKIKLLTAHYDRVPGTPGVLDNSCAVWQLLDWASSKDEKENVIIAFTDKEEISGSEHVYTQGAYYLGLALNRLGIDKPFVFSFDVTGRGNTVIVANTVQKVLEQYPGLHSLQEAVTRVSNVFIEQAKKELACVTAALPFGENLGFMLSGQPALELSILPEDESMLLASVPELNAQWTASGELPATWKRLHTPLDTIDGITSSAFFVMQKVLSIIGKLFIPLS